MTPDEALSQFLREDYAPLVQEQLNRPLAFEWKPSPEYLAAREAKLAPLREALANVGADYDTAYDIGELHRYGTHGPGDW